MGALALPWAFAGLLSSTSRLHAHPGAQAVRLGNSMLVKSYSTGSAITSARYLPMSQQIYISSHACLLVYEGAPTSSCSRA